MMWLQNVEKEKLIFDLINTIAWSAPSAIVTGGMGAGGQIGKTQVDFADHMQTYSP